MRTQSRPVFFPVPSKLGTGLLNYPAQMSESGRLKKERTAGLVINCLLSCHRILKIKFTKKSTEIDAHDSKLQWLKRDWGQVVQFSSSRSWLASSLFFFDIKMYPQENFACVNCYIKKNDRFHRRRAKFMGLSIAPLVPTLQSWALQVFF